MVPEKTPRPLQRVRETERNVNIPLLMTASDTAANGAVRSKKRPGQHSVRVEIKRPGIGVGPAIGDPVSGEIRRGQQSVVDINPAEHDAARVIGERA